MTRDEKKILKLIQYGIDSDLAQSLVRHRFGVSKLRETGLDELVAIVGNEEKALEVKRAILRTPIPEDTLQRLVTECDWSCCLCWNVDNRQSVVVHHIEAYEKTQDNSYENLVVVCPTHHSQAHSKSDLTGKLLPAQLIKQKKEDFIEAIRQAKAGERPFPGRELSPHYWWGEILRNCHHQINSSLTSYTNKYDSTLYVSRNIEQTFWRFVESDKTGFLVVDKSGQGKSNLVCSLASQLLAEEKAVILIRGDVDLVDENDLERLLCKSLGYDPANYRIHIDSIAQTLKHQNETLYIFLDGISESNTLPVANRALLNLLTNLAELGRFKLCVTCRDIVWHRLGFDLPSDLFFLEKPKDFNNVDPKHLVQSLSDEELDKCLPLYQHKYDVKFTPSAMARDQLKHPLMLRIFCEAYQGETLGPVSNVPTAKTFDLFLSKKIRAIENRLDYKIKSNFLLRILRLVVFEMWNNNDAKSLDEARWHHSLPVSATVDYEIILQEFENEGIIEIQENKITLERKLRIVFDQLSEHLLLQQLLALFPEPVIQSFTAKRDFEILLSHVKQKTAGMNDFKSLSLIGMHLPESQKRRRFLKALMLYDFQTFCACLAQIPPVGNMSKCRPEAQYYLAKELKRWYELIAANAFPKIYGEFDPWLGKVDVKMIGIKMSTSPECKEISYSYESYDNQIPQKQLVKVEQVSNYPTFYISVSDGSNSVLLHDPEKGVMISTFRGGPKGEVNRIINYKFFPRFSGDSYNIPERMALHDIWEEIKNIITNDSLPFQPIHLITERAWVTAADIPGIVAEGLDFDSLKKQIPGLFSRFSGQDYKSVKIRAQLGKLISQLSMLKEPLQQDDRLNFELQSKLREQPIGSGMQDIELREYLFRVIMGATEAYRVTVEANFPNLKPVLNVYANMPFKVVIVTDRANVMYSFLPVETWEEVEDKQIVALIENNSLSLKDSWLQVDIDGKEVHFENAVLEYLKKLNRMRPTVHPVSNIVSINEFFSETPMNHFTRKWLLQDLQVVFGL